MTEPTNTPVELLDENLEITLRELCRACDTHAEFVMELVEYGVLSPRGRAPGEWRFPGTDLVRIKRAIRLRRDFDLNLSGLALSLELLEEVQYLRRLLAELESRRG